MSEKFFTHDELEAQTRAPKPKPQVDPDRGTLRRLSDAVDNIFMPVADKLDAFGKGAEYGVLGEVAPYLKGPFQLKSPEAYRQERDAIRKEHPGTFGAGDVAGTTGRDLALVG